MNDREFLEKEVERALQPLPALSLVATWSQKCDLHLLSNHRSEWASRALGENRERFKTVTISDTVGYCKPDQSIFQRVGVQAQSRGPIHYVDDHEKNLNVAREMGWSIILADKKGNWIDTVDAILAERVENTPAADRKGN